MGKVYIYLAILILRTLVAADSSAGECITESCEGDSLAPVKGGLLIQKATAADSQVLHDNRAFSPTKHAGCYNMINVCTHDQPADAQAWFDATWKAWKLGFAVCCDLRYNEQLCTRMDATLFDLEGPEFSDGRLVKDTPDPQLDEFCNEIDGLLQAHDGHDALAQIKAASSASLLQTMKSQVTSKLLIKVASGVRTKTGLTKLFSKSSRKVRANAAKQRISHCRSNNSCWEEMRGVQQFLNTALLEIQPWLNQDAAGCDYYGGYAKGCDYYCEDMKTSSECLSVRNASDPSATVCRWFTMNMKDENYKDIYYCRRSDEDVDDDSFPAGALVSVSLDRTDDVLVEQLRRGMQLVSPEFQSQDAKTSSAEFMIDQHFFRDDVQTRILDCFEISHAFMRSGRPLVMTGDHLVFVQRYTGDQKHTWILERASAVHEGDIVFSLDADSNRTRASKVTRVRRVKARGSYAPITTSGRLFVEGVAVSSLALSKRSWADAWDLASHLPEHRSLWSERLLLGGTFLPRILYNLGMDIEWLHKPSPTRDLAERTVEKALKMLLWIYTSSATVV